MTAPAVVLDWRDRRHAAGRLGLCRHCRQGRTILRDDQHRPAHKVCAEAAATAAAPHETGGRLA